MFLIMKKILSIWNCAFGFTAVICLIWYEFFIWGYACTYKNIECLKCVYWIWRYMDVALYGADAE